GVSGHGARPHGGVQQEGDEDSQATRRQAGQRKAAADPRRGADTGQLGQPRGGDQPRPARDRARAQRRGPREGRRGRDADRTGPGTRSAAARGENRPGGRRRTRGIDEPVDGLADEAVGDEGGGQEGGGQEDRGEEGGREEGRRAGD